MNTHRDEDGSQDSPRDGSTGERFPATRHSVIVAVRSGESEIRRQGLDLLVAGYWKPVYKYLRLQWHASEDDARDLTQSFFARAIEKGFLDRYEPGRARFRTFLRMGLDGFVSNERKAAARQKRGGGAVALSLDCAGAEGEMRALDPAAGAGPATADGDEIFRREWVRSLFEIAVTALRDRCAAAGKSVHFALFERYDLDADDPARRPTYADLGRDFGLTEIQVTNHLAFARREFRRLALETLRSLCGDESEYEDEKRSLFLGPEGK